MAVTADIGLIGLGTMGSALALNIAENAGRIAVWNRTTATTHAFHEAAGALAASITPCETLEALVAAIRPPRAIILMVPAGQPVDDQLAALAPYLSPDDLVIDAGNANFHDTNRRARAGLPFRFLGMGVSGGEEGARHGPAIMGGGAKPDWDRITPILTAIAASYQGAPCADWMGPEGAGHFVKTVHNGIEYADMQMIAEVYGLMRDGLGLQAPAIAEAFGQWNTGPLQSYLIEISAQVAAATDPLTGAAMLDVILDKAGQKGTGRWTAIEAQHLSAPIPVIEAAVAARNTSAQLDERVAGEALFGPGPQAVTEGLGLPDLHDALLAGKILCYAQGFSMTAAAAPAFGWDLQLPSIARVWRAGCIIRSALLDAMARALAEDPARSLMLAPAFAAELQRCVPSLRRVVSVAALQGHSVPALSAGLAWFDAMRTRRGTANMIQAQRDFFGAHGFDRLDGADNHHGPWGASA